MEQLLKVIGIFAILFVNGSSSQSIWFPDESCLNPDNLQGLCIDIYECPSLLKILRDNHRTSQDTEFLQKSQCGRKGSTILVCCPPEIESRSGSTPLPKYVNNSHLLPNCGISFDYKILGGTNTKLDEYPWMALIEYTKPLNIKGHHCGATLINNRYVVTAAHCVTGRAIPADWRISGIRLGEWDRSTDPDCEVSTSGQKECADPHLDVGIEEIIHHPEYNAQDSNNLNDIALIRLNREVAFTDFVSPVCLPVQSHLRSKTFEGVKMDVSGWGATKTGCASAIKLKAAVDGWTLTKCAQKYVTRQINLQNTQMCAGGEDGVDSCSGDSGGPLVVKEKVDNRDVYVLSGIVSFGPKPCGSLGWPGVYTRVGAYIDWIVTNIRA